MKTFKLFITESLSIKDVTHWKYKEGTQFGSNEGGVHEDEHGQKYYVKFPKKEEQARQEVASSEIHEKLGVSTLKPMLIQKKGRIGTATKWNDSLETKSPQHFEKLNKDQAKAVARIHHAGVITKNWDTVGLEHDNIMFHKKTGEAHAVDQGGSLNFRAQGGHKDFGPDIDEVHGFRDENVNRASAHVFNHTFKKHSDVEKSELTHARNLKYNDVHQILSKHGVNDAKKIADTLIKRRDLLLKHYGE